MEVVLSAAEQLGFLRGPRTLNAKLEEMMTMEPNSPSAREKASAVPVSKGGSSGGSNTCAMWAA